MRKWTGADVFHFRGRVVQSGEGTLQSKELDVQESAEAVDHYRKSCCGGFPRRCRCLGGSRERDAFESKDKFQLLYCCAADCTDEWFNEEERVLRAHSVCDVRRTPLNQEDM